MKDVVHQRFPLPINLGHIAFSNSHHINMMMSPCSYVFYIIAHCATKIQLIKGTVMFGNCQRPVFSPFVSHHEHKITSLWKFGLNRSSELRENDERKTPLLDDFVCFQIGSRPDTPHKFGKFRAWYTRGDFQSDARGQGAVSHNALTINSSPLLVTMEVSFYA